MFGLTAAVILRRSGHEVTVFEREPHPMMAASLVNQYRLHRGYHYPRAADTIRDCLEAEVSFRRMFGDAVIDGGEHLYCIAREGSKVSADEYRAVLDANGLEYTEVASGLVNSAAVSACFAVREGRLDPLRLRTLLGDMVRRAGVRVRCGTPVTADRLAGDFDAVVVASYAAMNEALGDADAPREYQFEVVEKPLVRLPRLGDRCIVVMDGPFMCADPLGRTGLHLLGNVVHAIHATNNGLRPEIPEPLQPLVNRGFIARPPVTRFPLFREEGRRFVPLLAEAGHVASMYAVRAVLPRRDATDERPTIVRRVADRIYTVFAGKFSSCVEAGEEVAAMLAQSEVQERERPVDLQRQFVTVDMPLRAPRQE